MTVLRVRALDSQGNPVAGRSAVLEAWTGNRYKNPYNGPSAVRGLTAVSGSDGWLSWTLPDLQRRPGPKGALWVITGAEAQPVVLATQPSDTTTTGTRVGTINTRGDLVPTPVPPVDTAAQATAAAQAAVSTVTAGAPTSLDTLAEVAAELQGRLSDTALRAAFGLRTDLSMLSRRDMPGAHALPVLNPTPPTLTAGTAGGASAISGSVLIEPDQSGAMTFFGAKIQRGTLYPDYLGVLGTATYTATTSGSPWAAEFILDTADATGRFEIEQKGNGSPLRVLTRDKVSGRWLYASAGASFTPDSSGNTFRHLVTLGAAGTYTVRIECTPTVVLNGIRVAATDAVRATGRIAQRVIVVGDSFTEPTIVDSGTNFPWDGWCQLASYATGYDIWSAGSGGTGYLQTNGGRVKFRDRLAADVISYAPDEIWWAGGINDSSFTKAQIQTEAATCFAQVASALPSCKQVVIAPFYKAGAPSYPQSLLNIRDGIKAAATAAGLTFLDVMNQPLVAPATPVSGALSATGTQFSGVVTVNVSWPVNRATYVLIDAGTTSAEVKKVVNVDDIGNGTWMLHLSPNLAFAHASGATVTQVGEGFLTGTGKQGTPVGDGTADRYTGSDGTHPTKAGHRNISDVVMRLYRLSAAA